MNSMLKQRWRIVLLTFGILAYSLSIAVQSGSDDKTGRIRGIVKTASGEPVPELDVDLRIFRPNQPTTHRPAVSGSDGGFTFSALDRNPENGYGVYAVYQGADYYSPLFRFTNDEPDIVYELTVYKSTTSDEHIAVMRHGIRIDSDEGGLRITEQLVLENSGDRMYIGSQAVKDGKHETLRVNLPTGFQNLQLSQSFIDFYTIIEETGVVFTMAIPPGEKPFELTYTLPAETSAYNLGRTLSVRTQAIDVVVLDTALEIESAALASSDMFEEQGQQYRHFAGQQFGKRSFIDIIIRAPEVTRTRALPTSPFFIGLFLILVFWILYAFFRRSPSRIFAQEAEVRERLQQRRHLLWMVAELDERFEAGEMAEDQYQRQRRERKDTIIELTRELQHIHLQ